MKYMIFQKSFMLCLFLLFISFSASAHVAAAEFDDLSGAASAWFYTKLGFAHIIPDGLDHILFVLSLFLSEPKVRSILKLSLAFTLAHSATLVLAMYGVVNIPAKIIEPVIALTIVIVAAANIFPGKRKHGRMGLVFLFGLVHGLGFASSLSTVGLPENDYLLSLITFNAGVELGQISVIVAAFLLIGKWFGEKPFYRKRILIPASLVIILVAATWTIQRIVE
jgi:hypothetical protein